MTPRRIAVLLGAATGLVTAIAMVRLVAGAFGGSVFAWLFVLLATLPWIGYVAWRARRGQVGPRARAAVTVLVITGLAVVWWSSLGPVLALVCSLAAFAVIWVADWPARVPRGEDRFVRIEELGAVDGDRS